MTRDLYLPGTPREAHPFQRCDGPCQTDKPPEGGVQMSPKKWVCASCWRVLRAKKK